MPSSAVRIFSDPDDYAAAIRAATVVLTVTRRERFSATLTRIDLHRLWMQRFSEEAPRVAHEANTAGRAIIMFRTEPGPSLRWRGVEVQPTVITRHREEEDCFQRSSGAARLAAMSLPVEDMVKIGTTVAGCDLTPPCDTLMITPPPAAMARLQQLHEAAGNLAKTAPEVLANPEAARGLEQCLIEAMVGCLGAGEICEDRVALRQHGSIMRRFHRVLEENEEEPLYIPEICTAIGVSDRTLRTCCHEHLGTSPKRFLVLRRLNLARRALLDAKPTASTVTEIAMQFGFWQFGRFAAEYRSLFGELPSAALQRATE